MTCNPLAHVSYLVCVVCLKVLYEADEIDTSMRVRDDYPDFKKRRLADTKKMKWKWKNMKKARIKYDK
jgi:hypothetical protein